eukprot:m.67232 g.67232  ORF g.67232 m.67232 type:complete len:489 (+) comp9853_c0_seq1:46-1512(+)
MELQLTKPAVGGIGMTLEHKYPAKNVSITAVKAGSAAEAAGLEAGDLIVSIDGVELTDKGVNDVKRALQHISGTVPVVVKRGDGAGPGLGAASGSTGTAFAATPARGVAPSQGQEKVAEMPTHNTLSDDRGLSSVTTTHGSAIDYLLAKDSGQLGAAAAPDTPEEQAKYPTAEERGLASSDTPKPGKAMSNLLRMLSEDGEGSGAGGGAALASAPDAAPSAEDRGLAGNAPRMGPSEARLLAAVDNDKQTGGGAASPSATSAPITPAPAAQTPAPRANPAPSTSAPVPRVSTQPPPKEPAPAAEPPAPADSDRAAAVSGLSESLAGLMRGVKLVPGQKEVVLKTRVCTICKQVIGAGTFLQHDGDSFHTKCFVCGGCSKPLTAQFSIDENGVRKCPECCASDAGVCGVCGKSTWHDDPMKRLEILYLEDASYHPDCYRCIDCNETLENGAFLLGGKLYCRAHKDQGGATPKKKGLTKMDRLMAAMEDQ